MKLEPEQKTLIETFPNYFLNFRIWRPGQADKERVRGLATMTGKRPEPVKLSPLPSQLSTPSSLLSRAQHRTPSSARRSDRKKSTPLRTPSIKSFMTPKTPGGTPGASTSSLATTPVSLNRQGVKRRRVLEEDKAGLQIYFYSSIQCTFYIYIMHSRNICFGWDLGENYSICSVNTYIRLIFR